MVNGDTILFFLFFSFFYFIPCHPFRLFVIHLMVMVRYTAKCLIAALYQHVRYVRGRVYCSTAAGTHTSICASKTVPCADCADCHMLILVLVEIVFSSFVIFGTKQWIKRSNDKTHLYLFVYKRRVEEKPHSLYSYKEKREARERESVRTVEGLAVE